MRRRTDRTRRLALLLLAAVAVAGAFGTTARAAGPSPTAAPTTSSTASPAPTATPAADSGACHIAPVLDTFCNIGGAIDSGPGGILSGATSDVGTSLVTAVTKWVASGAAWILGQVGDLLTATTQPDLGSAWFAGQYSTMAELAALLLTVFLLLAAVHGLLHGDPGRIARAFLLNAPSAVLGTLVALAVVERSIAATDAMSTAVSAHMHDDIGHFTAHVMDALSVATAGNPGAELFVVFLGAAAIAITGMILWLELLLREAATDICVLFLPLTLAASVWPATSSWLRRLVQTLAAIVLSKFVIVAVLALAVSALSADASAGGVKAILVGVVLLALAAYCPYAVLRLLPALDAGGRLARAARSGGGAGSAAVSCGSTRLAQRLVSGSTSAAVSTSTAGSRGATSGRRATASLVSMVGPTGAASTSERPWLASGPGQTVDPGADHPRDGARSPSLKSDEHPRLDVRPRLDADRFDSPGGSHE